MSDLPTGTVTFLFTDIEGSTVLWEQHRDAMRQALVRHDALVEQVVSEHQGHVVRPRGEGDSRFAVFARATDGVAAAAALQQALYAEPWCTPTPLRVRMALHTGEADLREGDYYGTAVNRCARLRAVAHGGQTLVSLATEQVVRDQLAAGLGLRDLGEHRLKDLQHSEHVFQLLMEGLPVDFPPLKTLDRLSHNLPVQRDPLIGREQEVATVVELLRRPSVGLVTLTGPGGVGKTRLSLQVAAELLDDFTQGLPDGVWLVELAPITDPLLVPSTIASTLRVPEQTAQPIIETLKGYLRAKQLLLVLDNFEQVVRAAAVVAELLKAAPGLKVLVTSREVLHLQGEQDYPVPPLALPEPMERPSVERLSQYAAVALFIRRAMAVKPDFRVTNETAPAIAEICVRLDGLPLAIELAAARIKHFPAQALLTRLDHRLRLLTGGARDLTPRQQTLRGAIDWSYNLLDPDEQRLFSRMGVFVGGATLNAISTVCDVGSSPGESLEIDVLDSVASLVDKSLVRQREGTDGDPRFSMLETIREYALEQLEARGEAGSLRQQHTDYYLVLVEEAEPELVAPQDRTGLDRLEIENDNLRAALAWCQTEADRGDADAGVVGLRLAGALWQFWVRRGHVSEGRVWLDKALASSQSSPASVRAKALRGAGGLAFTQDYTRATALCEESLALYRALGDTWGTAWALHTLGDSAVNHFDYERAHTFMEESLALFRELGDNVGMSKSFNGLGDIAFGRGDIAQARMFYERSLALCRELGNTFGVNWVLHRLGDIAVHEGDYARAAVLLAESLTGHRRLGDRWGTIWALLAMGDSARLQGEYGQALRRYHESLAVCRALEYPWGIENSLQQIAVCLVGMAGEAQIRGQQERATRLASAVEALLVCAKITLNPAERAACDRYIAAAHAESNEATLSGAWAEGRAMTLEQAIAYALEEVPDA